MRLRILQRNTLMLGICVIRGTTLSAVQSLNANDQPSNSQDVSLPHTATWRPGPLGVLVCACVVDFKYCCMCS